MSQAIVRILRCDGQDCQSILTTGDHQSAADLRTVGYRTGWWFGWNRPKEPATDVPRKRIDLCPDHNSAGGGS